MFSNATHTAITGYLEGFIQGLVDQFKAVGASKDKPLSQLRKEGALKPFHEAILPPQIRRINEFERSFSTRLGNTFEACAFLIAKDVHPKAQRGLAISQVQIPTTTAMLIEALVAENNRTGFPKTFLEQITDVRSARSSDTVSRPAIADLYFQHKDGSEWFFEIKSPKPNKGQCLEVTQRLLTIQAMQKSTATRTHTYFAMAYNPYGSRGEYRWPYATKHLDMDTQVLLQEEFWAVVGDDQGTYSAVLDIYAEIGNQKGKDMIDQLAFGF